MLSKREWEKYIDKNKFHSDCQLVSAVNAYYYLTGITIDDNKYEKFIDLCGCRYGSAIYIEKIYRALDMEIKWEGSFRLYSINDNISLPIEINVWHKRTGFHSALIIDYEPKVEAYRIANFKQITTIKGWFFREDLYQFITKVNGNSCKLIGLK